MACLALGLGLLLAPLPAQAQGPSLKDFLFGHPSGTELAPGRYAPQEGEPFLIDHSGDGAVLVRFADSAEVWVLKPDSGPRGDVIYKNDVGDEILRATRLGGLTFFSHLHPTGEATAYYGEASGLKLAPVPSPTVLFQAMVQASVRASRAVQHLVVFEAEDLSPHDLEPTSGALIADAAATTADAFSRLAAQGQTGKLLAARYLRVRFVTGREPQARTSGAVLFVTVNPALGYGGRPSSARLMTVMARK